MRRPDGRHPRRVKIDVVFGDSRDASRARSHLHLCARGGAQRRPIIVDEDPRDPASERLLCVRRKVEREIAAVTLLDVRDLIATERLSVRPRRRRFRSRIGGQQRGFVGPGRWRRRYEWEIALGDAER